jgi:hypothetical protein
LTILILILLAILFVLLQMVALNGASERQGLMAMGLALGCQSLVILLLGTLAARPSDHILDRQGRVEQHPGRGGHGARLDNDRRSDRISIHDYCYSPGRDTLVACAGEGNIHTVG